MADRGLIAWSYDGRHLAYNSQSAVFLVDVESGRITDQIDGLHDWYIPPAWHPSESKLATVNRNHMTIYNNNEYMANVKEAELPDDRFHIVVFNARGPLTEEQFKKLSLLKKLNSFNYYYANPVDADFLPFEGVMSLDQFRTAGIGVSADTLRVFALSKLTALRVAYTNVGEAGVTYACQTWPDLEEFVFGSPANGPHLITDAVAPALLKLRKLKRLHVFHTMISDQSVPVLASMKGLIVLDVRGTKITEDGLRTLQQELPECEIISGEFQ